MTLDEFDKLPNVEQLKYHHTAMFRGYVTRKEYGIIEPYNGKFGNGFVVKRPNWNSTQYSFVDYYIYE